PHLRAVGREVALPVLDRRVDRDVGLAGPVGRDGRGHEGHRVVVHGEHGHAVQVVVLERGHGGVLDVDVVDVRAEGSRDVDAVHAGVRERREAVPELAERRDAAQRRAAVGQEVSLLLGRQQVDLGRSGRDARARRVRRVHADERRQTRGGVRLRQVDGQVVAGDDLHAVERVGRGAAGGLDRRLDDHVLHAGGRDVDVVHAALAHGGATVAGDAARAEGIRGGRERAAVLVEALDGCGGDEVAEGVLHGDREVRQLADLDVRRVGGDVGATARGDGQGRRRALPVDREHHVARAARDEVADRRDAGRAVVRDVTRGGARGGVRGEDRAGDGDVLREVAAGTLGAGGARRAAHVAARAARLAQGVLEERLAGDVQQDRLALETQGAARAGEDGDRRERVPAAVREGEVDARGGGGNKRGRAGVLRVARRVVADGQAEGVRAAQPEAGAGHEVDAAGVLVDAEGLGQ